MDEIFFGYPPLTATLKKLTSLKESQMEILFQFVEESGFARDLTQCKTISKKLNEELKPSEIFQIFGSIRFLYDRCRTWEEGEGEYKVQLKEFLELTGLITETDKESEETGYQRLDRLVAKNRVVERKRKVNWLKTGILDTAIDFSSRIDLRPRFSEDRGKIEDLIPGIVLRIVSDGNRGDEKTQVFQLTKEGLSKLRRSLEEVEKKLDTLSSDPIIGPKILGTSKNN